MNSPIHFKPNQKMEFLTTPDSRFDNLPDYSFAPNYLEVGDGLKMHYVDEGPKDGENCLVTTWRT